MECEQVFTQGHEGPPAPATVPGGCRGTPVPLRRVDVHTRAPLHATTSGGSPPDLLGETPGNELRLRGELWGHKQPRHGGRFGVGVGAAVLLLKRQAQVDRLALRGTRVPLRPQSSAHWPGKWDSTREETDRGEVVLLLAWGISARQWAALTLAGPARSQAACHQGLVPSPHASGASGHSVPACMEHRSPVLRGPSMVN